MRWILLKGQSDWPVPEEYMHLQWPLHEVSVRFRNIVWPGDSGASEAVRHLLSSTLQGWILAIQGPQILLSSFGSRHDHSRIADGSGQHG